MKINFTYIFTSIIYTSIVSCSSTHLNAATFEVSANMYYFTYEEFSETGQSLDRENGLLPGIKIKTSQQHNHNTYTFYSAFNAGKVDYTGGTQSGQPHTTKTEEQLFQFGFEFLTQKIEPISGRFIFGLRHWIWDRNILDKGNIRGLHEIYSWNEISVGLNFTSKNKSNSFYWSNISALYIINPEMEIFLDSSSETLNMTQKPGFRLHLGKTWKQTNRYSYNVSFMIEYWRFGRSNSVFTNDFFGSPSFITEPDSETLNSVLEFNYIYYF